MDEYNVLSLNILLLLHSHPQNGDIELSGVEVVVIVGKDAFHRKIVWGRSSDQRGSGSDGNVSRGQAHVSVHSMEDVLGEGQGMVGIQDDSFAESTADNVHRHMRRIITDHGDLGTGQAQHG